MRLSDFDELGYAIYIGCFSLGMLLASGYTLRYICKLYAKEIIEWPGAKPLVAPVVILVLHSLCDYGEDE